MFIESTVPGWPTLAVLISFLGGLGFANLGILGLYLGKVFDEVKGRPLYIVESDTGGRTQSEKVGKELDSND
jgi:dolichol-phosphate mannosyltransferase